MYIIYLQMGRECVFACRNKFWIWRIFFTV